MCRHCIRSPTGICCVAPLLMATIYADYGDEPEDEFIPLPPFLACSYYDLEMDSFEDDIIFYNSRLPEQAHILELGSGSARVGSKLLSDKRRVIGLDISIDMLRKARDRNLPGLQTVAMDMTEFAFKQSLWTQFSFHITA